MDVALTILLDAIEHASEQLSAATPAVR